ncbi:MAG: hypothetical protein WC806_01550 [Candidatus Gracilibacteria bacterium]|jgi:hypothetical protein
MAEEQDQWREVDLLGDERSDFIVDVKKGDETVRQEKENRLKQFAKVLGLGE